MAQTSRRGLLQTFGVLALSTAPGAAHALTNKEKFKLEQAEVAKARREAEAEAAKPINKLKAVRESLAKGAQLLEEGEWGELRDTIEALSGGTSKSGGASQSGGVVKILRSKGAFSESAVKEALEVYTMLRKDLVVVEQFAYEQQMSGLSNNAFSGYCAPGVVPRDEPGACKLKPAADKAPSVAALQKGVEQLDQIIKLCS